jgi:hypothetical protein
MIIIINHSHDPSTASASAAGHAQTVRPPGAAAYTGRAFKQNLNFEFLFEFSLIKSSPRRDRGFPRNDGTPIL